MVNWQFGGHTRQAYWFGWWGSHKCRMHLLKIENVRHRNGQPRFSKRILEAGVTLGRTQAAAYAERMMFALDIGSHNRYNIAGNLVTNARAILC